MMTESYREHPEKAPEVHYRLRVFRRDNPSEVVFFDRPPYRGPEEWSVYRLQIVWDQGWGPDGPTDATVPPLFGDSFAGIPEKDQPRGETPPEDVAMGRTPPDRVYIGEKVPEGEGSAAASMPNWDITAPGGGFLSISKQLLDSVPKARDLLPSFSAMFAPICYEWDRPKATKGAVWTCTGKCGKTYIAKKRRPPRQGGDYCFECHRTTPKGPKPKKRWMWVAEA